MHNRNTVLIYCCIALFPSCEEFLPVRNDPSEIFTGFLETSYRYTSKGNGIVFTGNLINNFDESLSDVAKIDGTLEIEWIAPIENIGSINPKRTVRLTAEHISAPGYDRYTKILTINPRDTVKINFFWDFKFDDSTDIRNVRYFQEQAKILDCSVIGGKIIDTPRVVYKSQPFKVKCTMKFFDKLAVLSIPETILYSCSINYYPTLFDILCPKGFIVPNNNLTPCDLR